MSIAAYLQTELVALSNEARRKHPEIKEVCHGFRMSASGYRAKELSGDPYLTRFAPLFFYNRLPNESLRCCVTRDKDRA